MTPCKRSLLTLTAVTSPISTFLYLILVLPASKPSAVLKLIVIVGPRSSTAFTPSQAPMIKATAGINQTSETVQPRFRATAASGISKISGSTGVRSMVPPHGIPNESWVKRLRGKHRQHHDRAESD